MNEIKMFPKQYNKWSGYLAQSFRAITFFFDKTGS